MSTIYQSIEILSREKGIDAQIVIDAVKDAMLVAARKHFKTTEDLVAELDERTGMLQIYGVRRIVEDPQDAVHEVSLQEAQGIDPQAELGGELRVVKPTDGLGRISAQTAKQVILQKVREAERETLFSEYGNRVGELVPCTVKRSEMQDVVVDMGKTEGRMPKREQSRLENYSVGDRLRCIIKAVEKTGKFSGVLVSRAVPELVMRLFEQEVPEIYDGTVVIKACAREAGERTKIAVASRDRDVDCVGACVGMKGMRVQSIIRELRGEKIDIIPYSEDVVQYATSALNPAKVSRVSIVSSADRHMEVIVDDTQLSLAIGKKGQNVRLAAKLLGWKIDIKSEEEKRQEVESAMAALTVPGAPVSVLIDHGLPESIVEQLLEGGVPTVEKLGSMTPEELEELPGVGPDSIGYIQVAINSYYGQYDEPVDGSLPMDASVPSDTLLEEPEPSGEAEQAAEAEQDAVEQQPDWGGATDSRQAGADVDELATRRGPDSQ